MSKRDINNISFDQLIKIKGIGEALALRIIEKRKEVNSFENISELRTVKGVGEALYTKLKNNFMIKEKQDNLKGIRLNEGCGACSYLKLRNNKCFICTKQNDDVITTLKKAQKTYNTVNFPKWCPWEDKIELSKIEIPKRFVPPNGWKLKERKEYYQKNGEMDEPIVVKTIGKDRYLLTDGYTRYLAGKELGVEKLRTIVKS